MPQARRVDEDPMVEAVKMTRKVPAWKSISGRVWFSFFVALTCEITAGTLYNYAAWSGDLKTVQNYNQSQTDLVGSLGNVGQYMGPVAGIVFDIFGTRIACLVASVFNFLGYFLLYLTTKGHITGAATSAGVQGFFLLISGLGSQILYLTALSSNVKVFPAQYRGLVIGTLVSTYGLCATVYTAIRNSFWDHPDSAPESVFISDLSAFQLFMSVSVAAISIVAAFGLAQIGGHESDDKSGDEEALISTSARAKSAWKRVWDTLYDKIISGTFWLLFIAFFLGVGAGLLHINNFAQLVKALNFDTSDANAVLICVTIQSVFNAVGRFSMGISDYVPIRRGYWLVLGLLMMALGQLLAGAIFTEGNFTRIYGTTVLIGFSYGMLWSITPTITSELWGTKNFAQNWGWVLLAAAATTYAFNGMAGSFYDHQALTHPGIDGEEPNPNDCEGHTCFQKAYFTAAGLCVLGAIIAAILAPRTHYGKKPVDVFLAEKDEYNDDASPVVGGNPTRRKSKISSVTELHSPQQEKNSMEAQEA